MGRHTMRRSGRPRTLNALLSANRVSKIDDLSTDALILFELLTTIVDIKYRQEYLKSFDYNKDKRYSTSIKNNKVLADQVSPVDNGLLG
jgi:predicted membrane chloride channel (bestrophin family)